MGIIAVKEAPELGTHWAGGGTDQRGNIRTTGNVNARDS